MPIEAHLPAEVAQWELGAHLLGRILLGDDTSTESLIDERVLIKDGPREQFHQVAEFSPWSLGEIDELRRLFPISRYSNFSGVHGTSIRRGPSGQPCLGIYAEREMEAKLLSALNEFRPKTQFPYEITEACRAVFASSRLRGGCPVGPSQGNKYGTLGAWLQEASNGELIGVSNNHVLCDFNTFKAGSEVCHIDDADKKTVIGTVSDLTELRQLDRQNMHASRNLVDLAWCRPQSTDDIETGIGPNGLKPTGEIDLIREYIDRDDVKVRMFGARSGDVTGTICAVGKWVVYRDDVGAEYLFQNQLEIEFSAADQGDSGAVICNRSRASTDRICDALARCKDGFWEIFCLLID